MRPIVTSLIILLPFVAAVLLSKSPYWLVSAIAGGAIAGVMTGLLRTGRLFVGVDESNLSRVVRTTFYFLALGIAVAADISWRALLAYAVPWFLCMFVMFTWDAYISGR